MVKHYAGDDSDLQLAHGGVLAAYAGQTSRPTRRRCCASSRGQHPTLGRAYRECGYAPMVELLRYLEANGFTTYIASGGDRDFMRPVASDMYGIPPRAGHRQPPRSSTAATTRRHDLYKAAMDFFDDGPEKPVRIWSRIGRRPILSAGNSNGDMPMLDSAGRASPALRLLLLHDDAEREFDYTAGAENALERRTKRAGRSSA